ncbi:serine/threonine protein phosphatase [Salinigranum rubrum]|uniref:Serine/threonine protein phosphatase n=1 Tax=Salinigranum rubrum TaxID=755307 RepID=A0A2I8VH83_9EURY|nr:metallophosphoesterase [Salinigranum rubrum]AUV81292.1 serine/threonine protein phosphatase [Salinigranum rubrum]
MRTAAGSAVGPVFARLASPRPDTPTRLFVAADAHVSPTASGTWKVFHRSETRLRTAVDVANDLAVDACVFVGDLTRDGHEREYAAADAVLSELSVPFVAVPGNHDVPKRWDDYVAPSAAAFGERYGFGQYPFHVTVGGLDLLCLDTASAGGRLTETHEGEVSAATLDWLRRRVDEADHPVVAMHHMLFHPRDHVGSFPDGDFYRLRNHAPLREALTDRGDVLTLSGHIHLPSTTARDGVRELVAPSTCSFPPSGLLLESGPQGTTVRLVPLAGGQGMTEAYIRADAGNAHGQGIAAHADDGLFTVLPQVDERVDVVGADVPGALRWR